MAAKRIKILMVIDHLDAGGAQSFLVDLVRGLDRERFQVVVCALRRSSRYVTALESAGARVMIFNSSKFNPFKLLRLVCLVRQEKVAIVHTHLTAARLFGGIAAAMNSTPLLTHDHSGEEYLKKHPVLAKSIFYPLDRFLMRYTQKVLAVSSSVARFNQDVKRIDASRVDILSNWVDIEKFKPTDTAPSLPEAWQLPAAAMAIGTVGRLDEVKGHRTLIAAIPHILTKHPRAYFLLLGDGPEHQSLQAQAERAGVLEHVRFCGHVDDVENILPGLDLFVLPSNYECSPVALLEAMAVGLPLVANRVGGIPEMVENDVNGLLISPASSSELAAAVNVLLADEGLRDRLGRAARATACSRFNRDAGLALLQDQYLRYGRS
jgi:glycosyltransferase involved in cell wall biosynthesis